MNLAIIFIPLFNFLTLSIFGRFFGKHGAKLIAPFFMVLAAVLSLVAFYEVGFLGNFSYITLGTWINCGLFVVNWGFLFDSLTVTMFVVVNVVSALVHIYSVYYMSEDPFFVRFLSYLSFFTFFMLILVSADNFIQLFLGWEGVGLCSYLLINFWYTRVQANKAALKALIMNRIGDFGLTLGILLVFSIFKSVDFGTVFSLVSYLDWESFTWTFTLMEYELFSFSVNPLNLICFLLLIGAVGKSAQVGLHTWLPDAMEGPTPVSALIHAATMVTAGVFLIIRCSPLFEFAPEVLVFITFLGAVTAFFAASVGLVQNDVKKIIAYSTCSQLGYMIFACGLSGYSASLFHLTNHAFFKALLFLSAGSIIHGLCNEQDLRKMGGLARLLPFTYTMVLIGSLALMGFPFLAGFYSKDLILELAYSKYTVSGFFSFWLGTITALFTAFYSLRLIFLVFFGKTNAFRSYLHKGFTTHLHELPFGMAVPLIVLGFGSIFSGYMLKDLMVGVGTPFFGESIYIDPRNSSLVDAEFLPVSIKLIPTFYSLFGLWLGIFIHKYRSVNINTLFLKGRLFNFLSNKWNIDSFYNKTVGSFVLSFGFRYCFMVVDRGFLELFGPNGLVFSFRRLGNRITSFQTGYIFNYTAFILYSFLFIFFFFWLKF